MDHKYIIVFRCSAKIGKSYKSSTSNLTIDNYYTSYRWWGIFSKTELHLLTQRRKARREIPLELLPHKSRTVASSLFGFQDDKTIVSYYMTKKNKAALLCKQTTYYFTL